MAGLLAGEPWIRLGISTAVFAAMAVWEVVAPRRSQAIGRSVRWPNNLGVLIIDTIVLRLLFPAAAVGSALGGEEQGWGLLNNLALPNDRCDRGCDRARSRNLFSARLVSCRAVLWRLHRMHHADLEFDVTTGVRFHPVEILLSMVISSAWYWPWGRPPWRS